MILDVKLVYGILTLINYFTILYNTLVYNNFDSILEYPAFFSNYITLSISLFTVHLYSKKILSVLNRRKLYYITLGYNISLFLYLNIAICLLPRYIYTFKEGQLFKDNSYLSYLLSLILLTFAFSSVLKKEYNKYREVVRYVTII